MPEPVHPDIIASNVTFKCICGAANSMATEEMEIVCATCGAKISKWPNYNMLYIHYSTMHDWSIARQFNGD